MQYLISLVLTLLLEGLLALLWGIRGRDLWLVALVNILTNPLVVLWHNLVPGVLLGTALPEILAVSAEACIYLHKDNAIARPILFSICANAFSFGTGLVLNLIL